MSTPNLSIARVGVGDALGLRITDRCTKSSTSEKPYSDVEITPALIRQYGLDPNKLWGVSTTNECLYTAGYNSKITIKSYSETLVIDYNKTACLPLAATGEALTIRLRAELLGATNSVTLWFYQRPAYIG